MPHWRNFNPREGNVMAQKYGLRTVGQDKGGEMIMNVALFLSVYHSDYLVAHPHGFMPEP